MCASFFGQTLPRIVVRRELLDEHENALVLRDRQISCGSRDAVAGRGDNGNAVRRAIEELRGSRAKLVRASEEFVRSQFPRVSFAGKGGGPGFNDRLHQR